MSDNNPLNTKAPYYTWTEELYTSTLLDRKLELVEGPTIDMSGEQLLEFLWINICRGHRIKSKG
jgi:hypothetical protein